MSELKPCEGGVRCHHDPMCKPRHTRQPDNTELLARIEALTEHKSPVSEHPFYLFKDEVIEAIKELGGESDE